MPLAPDVDAAPDRPGLPVATPARGENGKAGDAKTPGTHTANVTQQDYFADVATRAVLPMLAERGQPFVMVYWSRDPDGSQHNAGDASTAWSRASTARPRSPASATPTTIWPACARRWPSSASPPRPTSS